MDFGIEIKGGKELAAKLTRLVEKVRTQDMSAALYAGGLVIRDDARIRAPLGHEPLPTRTGVHEKPGTLKKGIVVMRGRKRGDEISVVVGTTSTAFYGRFVEKGHRGRRPKGAAHLKVNPLTDKREIVAQAKPFMLPAAETKAQAAVDAMAAELRRRLEAQGV